MNPETDSIFPCCRHCTYHEPSLGAVHLIPCPRCAELDKVLEVGRSEDDAFGQTYRNEIMALQKIIHDQQLMIARAYRAGWEAREAEMYDPPRRGW